SATCPPVHRCQLCAHPCHLPVPISATFQCPSELSFSVTHQCESVPPISASQCRLPVPCPLVMPVNAHQCHLISATYQCSSVQPISAHHCSLIGAHN
ncbi:unnamed protein product, partial [Staurois parvus]